MNPEISIITPAYNSEKYISETVESVLKQTFTDWEMIIVDDASTDRTEDIVRSFAAKDSRIRYYRFDQNSGRPAVPRNHAIQRARGDYLAFLDSDDLWLPDKSEYQLNDMKRNGLEFSYGPTKLTSGGQDIYFDGKRGRSDLIKNSFIACLTVMIRNREQYRPIFDEDPHLKAAEDSYAWIQMYKKTDRIGCYDRHLSIYRVGGDDSILKEYHSDICKRMVKQYLFYSKLYLSEAITAREVVMNYFRVFINNAISWMKLSLYSWLKGKKKSE